MLNLDFHLDDFSDRSGGESVRVPLLDDKLLVVNVTPLVLDCSTDVVLEKGSPTSSAEKGCSPVTALGVLGGGGVSLIFRLLEEKKFSKESVRVPFHRLCGRLNCAGGDKPPCVLSEPRRSWSALGGDNRNCVGR